MFSFIIFIPRKRPKILYETGRLAKSEN